MSGHAGTCPVFACLLVAMVIGTSGCSQRISPEERDAARAGLEADSAPPGPEAARESAKSETSADSGVKLASAQSRIRVPRDEADRAGEENPDAAPDERLNPPAKLPAADAPLPLDNVDAADLTMPKVNLTEHHAAMCLVGVGDAFPDLQLSDLVGQKHTLSQLFGDKLTLVVFWNGSEPTALEELADLARYHQRRFADRGLAIVAINTGDPAQLAGELAEQAGAAITILSDADGSALKQVATAKVPRSYLLDPTGRIVWFDLEYSPTTRRDMVQAIRYLLAQQ